MRGERGCLSERCRALQDEESPLHTASRIGRVEVIELLLAHGADMEAKDGVSVERGKGCRMRM